MNRTFWSDVLRDGAILGLVMALSRIIENTLQLQSTMSVATTYLILVVEMLASTALFVFLVHRFAKRRAMAADPAEGFAYGQGLIYVFVLSVLTGILVGLANTLYIAALGYDSYVDGVVASMESTAEFVAQLDPTGAAAGSYNQMMDQIIETIESTPCPTVFDNILASLNSYITWGTLLGLIIARMVRREPKF